MHVVGAILNKAFNFFNQKIVIHLETRKFNFSSNALKWMESYLKDKVQCVRVQTSLLLSNELGFPQGYILEPLLFNLYCI